MDNTLTIKGNATPTFLEQILQRAGFRPEDTIWVRVHPRGIEITASEVRLEPAPLSKEERAHRLRIVRRLQGIWSEDDEKAFRQAREELWSQWQPRSFA
jgi:hypothetical protein